MADMKIFSGTNSRYVALRIAEQLGVELGKINISHFADGEFEVCYEEPVRGAEVYLVQSGFKGCCMALIDPAFQESIVRNVTEEYLKTFPDLKGKYMVHICDSADGLV